MEQETSSIDKSFLASLIVDWKQLDLRNTFAEAMKNTVKIARQPSSLAMLLFALAYIGLINMILSSLGSVFQSASWQQILS
jgi:hypothetical protein